MLRLFFGMSNDEGYPPEEPRIYGCDTLQKYMEDAAWDIKVYGLKKRYGSAAALFDSLLTLEGADMTGCTEVMLGFRELAPVVFTRQDALAARGVDVEGLCAVMEAAKILRAAVRGTATLDLDVNPPYNADADRL